MCVCVCVCVCVCMYACVCMYMCVLIISHAAGRKNADTALAPSRDSTAQSPATLTHSTAQSPATLTHSTAQSPATLTNSSMLKHLAPNTKTHIQTVRQRHTDRQTETHTHTPTPPPLTPLGPVSRAAGLPRPLAVLSAHQEVKLLQSLLGVGVFWRVRRQAFVTHLERRRRTERERERDGSS